MVIHDLLTVSLNEAATIDSVINGKGTAATAEDSGTPHTVTTYSNGTAG